MTSISRTIEMALKEDKKLSGAEVVGLLIGAALIWVVLSWQEAKTFNRVAEPEQEVSTWDAMFVSLRVVAFPAEEDPE